MRIRFWLLIILLLLGTVLRLYHIQAQSIWFDEGWSAYAAVQPTLRAAVEADATNPPLYYVLLNITTRAFGDSTLSLRYFSLLFGVLAIALAEKLGRRLFTTYAGLGAAFLVAFSPLMWWASQEARMYTFLAVLVLIAALAWYQLQRRPTRWAWLALWASELALLYAHNTGPVIVIWLNLITILAWIIKFNRQYRKNQTFSLPRIWGRGEVLTWFAGQIAVGILWSPWFITRFLLLPAANSALSNAPQFGLPLLGQLWGALWLGSWGMVIRPESDLASYSPIILVVTLIASILVIPWRKGASYWLLAHVVILTAGLVLGLAVLGNEIHSRYLVMIAPLLLTLIGAGLAAGTKHASSVVYSVRYAAAIIFLAAFFGAVYFLTQNPAYQHDDVRGMVNYYAHNLTASDSVLAWSYADRYDLAYYWDRLGVKAHRVTLPEGADLDKILPLLPASGDVALNIWYTQRADYRGMMGCLLGDGTINPPEQISFYGMTDELYRSPSLHLPELSSIDVGISTLAHVTAVGAIPVTQADQGLCLPLQIQLTQPATVDLKSVLIVKNALGWEIARDDAPFADAAQRTTSVLVPGDTLTAYPLLRLPYGAPPGDYSIFLRVYDEQAQPSGYDLSTSTSVQPVRDLPLATWKVSPGADWSQVKSASDLPVKRALTITDNLTLAADNIQSATLHNGNEIRLSLLWKGEDKLPDLTIDGNAGWQVTIPPSIVSERDDTALDWRTFRIPLDAPSGDAILHLPDGTPLATYTIQSLPALTEPPPFETPVDGSFVGVGSLVGYTLGSDSLDHTAPFDVTLVWRADQTAATSYTVFVQLLDESGQVIAQADAVPADNTRPTTSWRPSEYIVDVQHVTFHADAQPGTAHLIAGLYDPTTGTRVPLTSGADFITLREDISVN
ncbi:MAG: glycosyltransferase family 39 protein [Chloroflexota bacterium]